MENSFVILYEEASFIFDLFVYTYMVPGYLDRMLRKRALATSSFSIAVRDRELSIAYFRRAKVGYVEREMICREEGCWLSKCHWPSVRWIYFSDFFC